MADTNFLGLGWNFPIGQDAGHQIALTADGEESVRQSIWTILATSPGERVMRPDFGCGLGDLVFAVNNAATATAVTRAVREALATWEPRIDVLDVYAAPDPHQANVLNIEINYQVRSTNSRFNLVTQTTGLAATFSGWQPGTGVQPDPGQALIGVFGRFAELVIDRLNQAPDKNYLAFLNLIGAAQIPPRAARVPLTFHLSVNTPVEAVVPAGTLAAASPVPGEQDEVVFETERPLAITQSQLIAAYVSDTENDTYSDRSQQATGGLDQPFAVFAGDQPSPHQLFLACDPVLTQPGVRDAVLTLGTPDTWPRQNWPISWAAGCVRSSTCRCHPTGPGWSPSRPPSARRTRRTSRSPWSPLVGNRFYLSADRAFVAGGALAKLQVGLSHPGAGTNLQLSWYYQTDGGWQPLNTGSDLTDGTNAFTQNGEISFHIPMMWPETIYRNRSGRWLRVDVTTGGYTTQPEIATLTAGYDWQLPTLGRITVAGQPHPASRNPASRRPRRP